jgi:hypothetical protein
VSWRQYTIGDGRQEGGSFADIIKNTSGAGASACAAILQTDPITGCWFE